MKESYMEGVAHRHDPESCVVGREAGGEALTGAGAGSVLSSEITLSGCRPSWLKGKTTRHAPPAREVCDDPAESETRRMRRNSMHENREIPQESARAEGAGKVCDA